MKALIIFTLFGYLVGASFMVSASEGRLLCQDRKTVIEPDMQLPEATFNKDNAAKAKIVLESLDHQSSDLETSFAIENSQKILKGFALRQQALDSSSESARKAFCDFWIAEAFYHD
ncbi:hypothetical protein JYB87_07250 [Shewanella avicenniae]|uniref:Uncharacterized protein n=1 Tax=Shewanella avicenniae TaxID=2814294 RepID=A0ABX7QVP5_9GAMM|nr:hypothetical protein [Shewanella avicenniae]QSX35006.1 hypothetical protein JYB87_07250 [Shewanella avicenniae]